MSSQLSLTDADREAMLEAIGVGVRRRALPRHPGGVRFDRPLDLEPALSEPELVRHLEELAARNVDTTRELSFLGAGIYDHYVPAVVDAVLAARRAPDRVHALPGRDEPGRAAGDLRVPDGDLRADRDGRLERLRLRRHDRRGRRVLRGQARHGPREGRPRRDARPAGAAGREDLRGRLRARGRRGAARRRHDRPRPGGRGGRGRGGGALPAAELLRLPRARARARRGGERRRRARDRARRSDLARRAGGARQLRLRARDRRGPGRRQPPVLRRPALRLPGREERVRAAAAGADHRRDDRRERRARLRADAADARAAHPAREGDVQHHDEPDAARARRARLPLVARPAGAARGGGDLPGARRLRAGAARPRARLSGPGDVQGVRDPRAAATRAR